MKGRARPDPHQGGRRSLPGPGTPCAPAFSTGAILAAARQRRVRAPGRSERRSPPIPRIACDRARCGRGDGQRGARPMPRRQRTGAAAIAKLRPPALVECPARLLLVHPVVDVPLHPVLGIAVARLNLAFELLAVAVDLGDIVIGELAPLLLHLTAELLPAAFDAIPIHVKPPVCCWGVAAVCDVSWRGPYLHAARARLTSGAVRCLLGRPSQDLACATTLAGWGASAAASAKRCVSMEIPKEVEDEDDGKRNSHQPQDQSTTHASISLFSTSP